MAEFERLENKLKMIDANNIGADDLFEAFTLMINDAYRLTGKRGLGSYPVHYNDNYVPALLGTMNAALASYQEHTDCLADISERRKNNYDEAVAAIAKIQKEAEPLEKELEQLRQKQAELETVEKERDKLLEEKAQLENKIHEMESIDINTLQKEIDALKERQKDLEEQSIDGQATLSIINNAWESLKERPELSAILEESGGFKQFGQQITSYEELQTWFKNMHDGIEGSLELYKNTYKKVITAAESGGAT